MTPSDSTKLLREKLDDMRREKLDDKKRLEEAADQAVKCAEDACSPAQKE